MNIRTILALVTTLAAASQATADINVELRPATQTVPVNSTVLIEVVLVSDSGSDQLMASAEIVFTWEPQFLQLLGVDNTGGPLLMGFPPFPGFLPLNEADPPADGNAMYIALAFGGMPVAASPAGTLLTTLEFKALLETTGTPVGIPESLANPPGTTVIWDGTIPNYAVTGTLTGATVIIEGDGGGACGDVGSGDCCEANGTPFCDNAACCDAVCLTDPGCCDMAWDDLCVESARDQPLCGCPDCGDVGSGDCCEANGTPFCDNADCCATVCLLDAHCCDMGWDAVCAGLAQDHCAIICPTGACCFPDGTCLDALTPDTCLGMPGGVFQGVGSECLGSNSTIIVWGVDDRSSSDSQLFVLNITTADLNLVGPEHDDADIEGMTFFGTQVAGVTGTADDPHFLVSMDFSTGALTTLAPVDLHSGDSEVTGMATDGNGVQWAFAEDLGFGTIDLAGNFTIVVPSKQDIEGLAAALDGETLWGITGGGEIYEVDVSAGTVVEIDDVGSVFDDDIENLELFSSNELAFFARDDDDDDDLLFVIYNIDTGQLTTTLLRDLDLEDIETFVFASISSCPSQMAQGCGTALSGDCCSENNTAGCLDAGCCDIVCGMDPYCCDIRWDAICAGGADATCGELCVCAVPEVVVYAEIANNSGDGDGVSFEFDTRGTTQTAPGVRAFGSAASIPGQTDDPPTSLAYGSGDICSVQVSWEAFSATGCDLTHDAVVQMNGEAVAVINGQIIEIDCLAALNAAAGDVVSFGHDAGGGSPAPAPLLLIVTVQDEDGNQATDILDLCEICEAASSTDGNNSPGGSAPSGQSSGGVNVVPSGP